MNNKVYITRIAKFLPNNAISNDDMEKYLGTINEKPSLARRIVLKNNGIKERYYALDANGNVTHTSPEMATKAVEKLFDENFTVNQLELLAAGTASPEQLMPSHGVMIHGKLGGENMEVVSFSGSCCTGIQSLKYAYMSLASGDKNNAVCVASERFSAWMQAKYFSAEAEHLKQLEEKPILAFEKDFLRWMLSDGAGAVLLQKEPNTNGLSLEINWIELCSYANEIETCMYAGAAKDENGDLKGWALFEEDEWLSKSLFSLKQDTRILGENIVKLGGRFLIEVAQKRDLKPNDITWFLPHLSSMFFKDKIFQELDSLGFAIDKEKWFLNLPRVGNIAAASSFVMLEELFQSNLLKKGDTILLMIPESARFSYGYCLLTVC